jgi:peptidoglycan/LPS O-acetylase OafA/YrhL
MGLAGATAKLHGRGLPIAPKRFTPSRPNGRALPAFDGTHMLDKALETPDVIAARAATALDFRPDINGLRALAVLGVVIFHADRAWLPGGFVGVDIFFVISGFLISRIILSQCAAGRFSLAMFYARRAKRILPALLVVVSFVWIVGWFMAAPTQFREIGGGLLGNSYFTVNFWLMRLAGVGGYFGADATTKPLLHLWSLSIEEQFYLVWSVLLLALFKLERRLVFVVIAGLFVASFAYNVFLTPIDPIAAFYLPWARGWELALGALIAYREVFWLEALPYPPRPIANMGAGAGIALMLGAFLFMNETQIFPGWLAAVPTMGCALVIASPHSRPGEVALGNRVAGFFGAISYPLYLWHWPLFAFARIWPGVIPTAPVLLGLACVAVVLATLTYRLIEQPIATPFRRQPLATALALVALLGLTGFVGKLTYDAKGFPSRFPPLVDRIFDYQANGAESQPLLSCFYQRDDTRFSLDEERKRAARFFEAHHCAAIADPHKPTILIVGDSHAAHLFTGLQEIYGARANLLTLSSVYCVPLVENVAMDQGVAGTPRCRAINDYVFDAIRTIKPDIVIVGGYFAQYDHEANWRYPGFLDAVTAGARRLHADGAPSIIVAGQVPTWAPVLPILVGRDVLDRGTAAEFSPVGVRPDSLETDRVLASKNWGDGVRYVSQAAALCGADGCRRLIGENLPRDMLAVDYGHYGPAGSIFAVRTILAPVIDAELRRLGKS